MDWQQSVKKTWHKLSQVKQNCVNILSKMGVKYKNQFTDGFRLKQ